MKTLIEKCKMFISLAKVNMYIISDIENYEVVKIYTIPHFMSNSITSAIDQVYRLRASGNQEKPYFYKSPSHMCFLALEDSRTNSIIIIGPFTDGPIDIDQVKYIGYQMKLTNENVEIYNNFINTIPMFSDNDILSLSSVFKAILETNVHSVELTNVTEELMPNVKNDFSSKFEQYDFVKTNFEIEERMLKIVESGDLKALENLTSQGVNIPPRNPFDPLREAKNLDLTINSICMRAAVKGGLSPHLAHSMSHKYAVLIEKQTNSKTASALSQNIIFDYTKAVNKYSLNLYSGLVKESIIYIRRHITEAISLQDIAANLNTSKEHLSRQFKKETSETISHFIQKIKIQESLELVSSKQYSFSTISYLFGFSNPSHYSTTFKKIMGVSPAHYQQKQKN